MTHPFLPLLERDGYLWLRHADGLYYGPIYPSHDDTLIRLEREGKLGHNSMACGEYRYMLRCPERTEDPS
jgi:hypothetical protein